MAAAVITRIGPLSRSGGIYALVWRVEDEAAAEAFIQIKGLRTTREDCVSTGFAIEPDDFRGARDEFVATQDRNDPKQAAS